MWGSVLTGQGALGLFQKFIAPRPLSPFKPLALSHTPVSAVLLKLATVLYQEYLLLILGFSCFQVTRCCTIPPCFLLLLPPQMQVL